MERERERERKRERALHAANRSKSKRTGKKEVGKQGILGGGGDGGIWPYVRLI